MALSACFLYNHIKTGQAHGARMCTEAGSPAFQRHTCRGILAIEQLGNATVRRRLLLIAKCTGNVASTVTLILLEIIKPAFVDVRLEDPCVDGSIPPRATKNIVHATPTLTGSCCRFWNPQSLFRSISGFASTPKNPR